MDNNILNTKNIWEVGNPSDFVNRYPLILNGQKVIVLEHHTQSYEQINKNISDALSNYDGLLEALNKINTKLSEIALERKLTYHEVMVQIIAQEAIEKTIIK